MYPPGIGGKMPEKRKKGQHLTWENRQEDTKRIAKSTGIQKLVLQNENGKRKPEVSFAFNCIQLFYKKMKLFGTLNSLNSIKRKGDKIEREKRRYN